MVFHGKVTNGVVVFTRDAAPPEGALVKVETVDVQVATGPDSTGGLWTGLVDLAGKAEGLPADLARQHDHYLYGTPKR